jgi:hypothetical protein
VFVLNRWALLVKQKRQKMSAKNLAKSPGAFIQAVVDTHYQEVLNNAVTAKLVQGDVGEEELFNAIMVAYNAGNVELVQYVLQVQLDVNRFSPEYQTELARLIPQIAPRPVYFQSNGSETGPVMENGNFYSNEGGGFNWDNLNDIIGTAGDVFSNIWGQVKPNNGPAPSPGPGQQPNAPAAGIDNTTLIVVAMAAIAAIIVLAIILKK